MADIFISYAQKSAPTAIKLVNALKDKGLDVWWDPELQAGQRFHDEIRQRLEDADAVIVIWSPASIASSYVKMEAGIAYGWDKLITVRTDDLAIDEIPDPFRVLHTINIDDIEKILAALGGKGIQPKGTNRRKRMSKEEIFSALSGVDPSLPVRLSDWLKKCQDLGFRVVASRSLILKSAITSFGDVNFGTIFPDGTLQTNYISASSKSVGDPSIAADYLDGIARLLDGATVRRDGTPWNWRVEVYGALPTVSKLLDRGEEWLALMQEARKRFAEASQSSRSIAPA